MNIDEIAKQLNSVAATIKELADELLGTAEEPAEEYGVPERVLASPRLVDECPGVGSYERVILGPNPPYGYNLRSERYKDTREITGEVLRGVGIGYGIILSGAANVTIRRCWLTNWHHAIAGFWDKTNAVTGGEVNITIEDCIITDCESHGIYLGTRDVEKGDIPCNVTLRRNLIYNCRYHGFQWNGRCRKLVLEENVIHTCRGKGISLINGPCESVVRNNLIINTYGGVVLYTYDSGSPVIRPYPIRNNRIYQNTIFIGERGYDMLSLQGCYGFILHDSTPEQNIPIESNTFKRNVVFAETPIMMRPDHVAQGSNVFENNLFTWDVSTFRSVDPRENDVSALDLRLREGTR